MDLKLKHIKMRDFTDIYNLTTNYNVMKWIGNGKTWDKNKVNKFINNSINDKKSKERNYYFYKIVDKKNFIGIIGFYKFKQEDKYFSLRVFILPVKQSKGYFSKSLKLLIKKLKKHYPETEYLYSSVRKDNKKMNIIMNKKYKFVKKYKMGYTKLNLYKIKI
jgi:RimJ/RimL family protein N-acetyltransferase